MQNVSILKVGSKCKINKYIGKPVYTYICKNELYNENSTSGSEDILQYASLLMGKQRTPIANC